MNGLFTDERFKKRLSWISDWVYKEIKTVPDKREVLARELTQFWFNI